MLSYKEYKQLNESLYGTINLGMKSTNSLTPPLGATGATEVVEAENTESNEESNEESIEEAKCGKMMKKGMDCDSADEKEKEEEDHDHDEDEKEEDHDEDEKGLTAAQKKLPEALQKSILSKKKKKAKKEWNEILADFEELLEGKDEMVANQVKNSLEGIKKLLETKEMTEEEKSWWQSVNTQLGSNPDLPGDLGFAPVGKITQALR